MHSILILFITLLLNCFAGASVAIAQIGNWKLEVKPKWDSALPDFAALRRTPGDISGSMTFHVARSGTIGCPESCAAWIVANGRIQKETVAEFKSFLAGLERQKLPIAIHSGGGDVDAAIEIGRLIRSMGLDMVVARAIVHDCADGRANCKDLQSNEIRAEPTGRNATCNSSCTFILAAGKGRYVMPGAHVGVHRILTETTIRSRHRTYQVETHRLGSEVVAKRRRLISEYETSQTKKNAQNAKKMGTKLNPYLQQMGVSARLVDLMDSAAPEDVRQLWQSEMLGIDLTTGSTTPQALLSGDPLKSIVTASAQIITSIESFAARHSRINMDLVAQAGEDYFSVLIGASISAYHQGSSFRPGSPIFWSAAPPQSSRLANTSLGGPILLALPKVAMCRLRRERVIHLNLGLALPGTRFIGLPHRFEGRQLFQSSRFFDSICI